MTVTNLPVLPYLGFIRRGIFCVLVTIAMCALSVSWARAAVSGEAAWEVSSVAHPYNFSVEDNAKCGPSQVRCDQYLVTLTNVGSRATSGVVTIIDTLPKNLKPVGLRALNLENNNPVGCGSVTAGGFATVTCTDGAPVAAGATIVVYVEVEVEPGIQIGRAHV
jgi:hypothetical protein